MSMFKAALAVALVIIGGVGALLGLFVTMWSLRTGQIALSYGRGANAVNETVTQAGQPDAYWRLVAELGFAPLIIGLAAAIIGWRMLKRGGS